MSVCLSVREGLSPGQTDKQTYITSVSYILYYSNSVMLTMLSKISYAAHTCNEPYTEIINLFVSIHALLGDSVYFICGLFNSVGSSI
jgi:hypothetical protein